MKLPCLACLIRPGAKIVSETETPLAGELSLKPEHQKRYEQVKAWREMQDDPNFTATPKDWPFRRSGMSKARDGKKSIRYKTFLIQQQKEDTPALPSLLQYHFTLENEVFA